MPKYLYDNSDITSNSKQLALLKQHFPNCFDKEGNFISHKMEEIVGAEGLDLSRESYTLNWLGKSYARLLANENPRTLIREDREHNRKEENQNSENLLIKGDNLEVLKHLTNAYFEQIKMIYIDPPYNTGSDGFVYSDNRKFTVEELSRLAGIDADESKRILEFTASRANSHSAWLTFMYPRLYVARELLREDGVIFISIDDNEVSQLKLLCDEVFGEENFVGQFIWKSRASEDNRHYTGVSSDHEYILTYSKNQDIRLIGVEKDLSKFTNRDNDKRGAWRSADITGLVPKALRPNCDYDLINPETDINYGSSPKGWRYEKSTMQKLIAEKRILWPDNAKGRPRRKLFLNEINDKYKNISTIIVDTNTSVGTKEINTMLGMNVFDFPKPVNLLKKIIEQVEKNSLILDFFAGSGTTAHAVMALNAEDGGNRKFITVQIDEKTDKKSEAYKAGYKSIFEITKARIEKANNQLNDKSGFKIFETTPIFKGYLDDLEELTDNSRLFNGAGLSNDELETLLTTWRVYDGMRLHKPLNELILGSYVAHHNKNTIYFMNKGFNLETLQAFIAKLDNDKYFEPSKIVLFGYNFDSKYQREFREALANYSNKKSIELDMVVRY